MANKKIFTIEINGLEESVKSVDALTEKIKALDKLLKDFKSKKIEIPIELSQDIGKFNKQIQELQKKASKTTGSPKLSTEEKAMAAAINARKKALDEVNKEYGEGKRTIADYKKETKEMVAETIRAKNESEGYANTLNGLKARLKDLNNLKGNIDLGSEDFQNISNEILEITTKLKEYEASMGSFGRNVGDYKNSITDAIGEMKALDKKTDDTAKSTEELEAKFKGLKGVKLNAENVKQYGISINDLKWQISQLERVLEGLDIGSDEWKTTNQELLNLKQTLGIIGNEMEAAVRAEDQLNTKIKLNINGMNLVFDDVNQAVGILEDKMYALAAAGKQNTKEFKDIADAAARLKIEVRAVDTSIDNMVEGGASINKVIGYFKGFSAIATAQTGISQLFGGSDEDTQKQMQVMTALIGVMESLKIVQEEMQKQTGFGKMMKNFSDGIDKLISKLVILKTNFQGLGTALKGKGLDLFSKQVDRAILTSEEFAKTLSNLKARASELGVVANTSIGLNKKVGEEIAKLEASEESLSATEKLRLSNLRLLNISLNMFMGTAGLASKTSYTFNDGLKALGISLKETGKAFLNNISYLITYIKQYNIFSKAARNSAKALIEQKAAAEGATLGFKGLANALKLVGQAAKLVRATLKAFLIFEVIGAVMELFEIITNGIKSIYDWAVGNSKLANSFNTVESRIDAANKALEKHLALIDRQKDKGNLSNLDATAEKYEIIKNAIDDSTKSLQDFIKLNDSAEAKPLEENFSDDGLTRFSDFEDKKEFLKEYADLLKAVEAGTDITDVAGGSWLEGVLKSADDAKSDLAIMQKRIIQDLQSQVLNIDFSKGEEAYKKFFDLIDSEAYSTALANIENLYPEEEWAKVLKARLENVREMYEQMTDASEASADAQIEDQKRIAEEELERTITMRDNYTSAISNDFKRQMQELKNRRQDEINKAGGDYDLLLSINVKYNELERRAKEAHYKQMQADANAYNDKLLAAQKRLRDLELEVEENSLEKRVKALNNQREDEIKEAEKNGILVGELRVAINDKYDKLIELEKKKHYDYLSKLADDYARKFQDLEQRMKGIDLEKQGDEVEIDYSVSTGTSENYTFDFSTVYGERIAEQRRFNEQRLQVELEYIEEKARIDRQGIELEGENNRIAEERRYDDQVKNLDELKEQGLISTSDYFSLIEKENELHSREIDRIETEKNNKILNSDEQLKNNRKDITSQSLAENAGLYSKYADDISNIMSNVGRETNIFGVLDYTKTSRQLKKAKVLVKEGLEDIAEERKNLEERLKSGDITFVDYKEAREQLEETEKTIKSQGKDINKALTGLFGEVAMQWKGMLDSWVSQISSLLNTANETQMILIDNQIAQVEKELEIQEKAYERAEEAAQKHKDKMNGIEDELKDARGARRQFLIDALAAQQKAYLEDVKAQQDAEAKKERLEKKQEALEKQRKKQEKKAKIQQALINTFMAVSNALAVSPWFVGAALSAVALALGMQNVAAIKETPIYENGGVIQGKRHKDGGVPVMGGRAFVEGGEFITNRQSTAANLPLLTMINDKKRAITPEDVIELISSNKHKKNVKSFKYFENGGQLPIYNESVEKVIQVQNAYEDNKQYVVQVTDIINAENNIKQIQVLSGLVNQ